MFRDFQPIHLPYMYFMHQGSVGSTQPETGHVYSH